MKKPPKQRIFDQSGGKRAGWLRRFNRLALAGLTAQAPCCLQARGISIELRDPLSNQPLANMLVSGQLSLGELGLFSPAQPLNPAIDGVFWLNRAEILQRPDTPGIPAGILYVLGASPGRGGLNLSVSDLGDTPVEVYVSYVGDLQPYLSEAQAAWLPGTPLNGGQYLRLPVDGAQIPLRGVGGQLSDAPLSQADAQLNLDLAIRVDREEPAGNKSGLLTFTLVSQ